MGKVFTAQRQALFELYDFLLVVLLHIVRWLHFVRFVVAALSAQTALRKKATSLPRELPGFWRPHVTDSSSKQHIRFRQPTGNEASDRDQLEQYFSKMKRDVTTRLSKEPEDHLLRSTLSFLTSIQEELYHRGEISRKIRCNNDVIKVLHKWEDCTRSSSC